MMSFALAWLLFLEGAPQEDPPRGANCNDLGPGFKAEDLGLGSTVCAFGFRA